MDTRLTAPARLNERFVRAFVARGSGLASARVIPANQTVPRPQVVSATSSTPFATVLLVTDTPDSRVIGNDGDRGDLRYQAQYRTAEYSVQFFSADASHAHRGASDPGAMDLAARLCLWVESDDGLISAEGGLKDPGWPAGTEMRLDHPLSWERMDDIESETYEERALVRMRCRYVAWYAADDRGVERFEATLVEDGTTVELSPTL